VVLAVSPHRSIPTKPPRSLRKEATMTMPSLVIAKASTEMKIDYFIENVFIVNFVFSLQLYANK
jgi:hypothetical protein